MESKTPARQNAEWRRLLKKKSFITIDPREVAEERDGEERERDMRESTGHTGSLACLAGISPDYASLLPMRIPISWENIPRPYCNILKMYLEDYS